MMLSGSFAHVTPDESIPEISHISSLKGSFILHVRPNAAAPHNALGAESSSEAQNRAAKHTKKKTLETWKFPKERFEVG